MSFAKHQPFLSLIASVKSLGHISNGLRSIVISVIPKMDSNIAGQVWCNTDPDGPPLGFCSLSGKTSYRQIAWSLEAAKLDCVMIVSL